MNNSVKHFISNTAVLFSYFWPNGKGSVAIENLAGKMAALPGNRTCQNEFVLLCRVSSLQNWSLKTPQKANFRD